MLGNLGSLFAVVLFGQLVHSLVFYGSMYAACTRRSPFKYYRGLPQVWITAFGTSSSAATLSTTVRCCGALGVSKECLNFVLPIVRRARAPKPALPSTRNYPAGGPELPAARPSNAVIASATTKAT